MQGTVRFYDHDRGFGFAKADDGTGDVFIHTRQVLDGDIGLMPGDRVEFEKGINPKNGREQAIKVRLLKGEDREAA